VPDRSGVQTTSTKPGGTKPVRWIAVACATFVAGTLFGMALTTGASSPAASKPKSTKTPQPKATKPKPKPAPAKVASADNKPWVLAYHVGYQRDLWPADKIDFASFTHLVVGRVKPNWDGTIRLDFDIDDQAGPQFAADLARRTTAAGRTPLLMLGGAGERDAFASALEPANRERFIGSILAIADQWGYAGFDLDYEPITPADEPKVLWLATELRKRRPNMVLTVPIVWININTDRLSTFPAQLTKVVDRLNVMTYSMSGAWGWPTWHSSPLDGETPVAPTSISSSIDAYLAAGVPGSKLGLGIGFYGQCWTGQTGPLQPITGTLAAEDSLMSSAIIASQYAPSMQRKWDPAARVPYLTSSRPAGALGCQYISYEDAQSVAEKAAFAKQRKLGAAIIWTAGQGYQQDTGTNPMLTATWKAFRK
jgi:chitinase